MGFIKRWFIKRALEKASSKSDMEKIADDVLKGAMQELQQTGRTADKILKAKIMRQESQHTLSKIRELDDEYDDDDDADEPVSMEDNLTNALFQKIVGGGLGSPTPQPTGEITGYDEAGLPIHAASSQPQVAANNSSLGNIVKKLSPEDIQALKDKFL